MAQYPLEGLLRPPLEFSSAAVSFAAAGLALAAPSALLMVPEVAYTSATLLGLFGIHRCREALRVLRYQRGLLVNHGRSVTMRTIPREDAQVFVGWGFEVSPIHTQRLHDLLRPQNRLYLSPRRVLFPFGFPHDAHRTGLPALHGVGLLEGERPIFLPRADDGAHVFVASTTGGGKSTLARMLVAQDVRDNACVIVIDPKGDPDLFLHTHASALAHDREFWFFHPGFPEQSCRWNPLVGDRVTTAATHVANALPDQGNAAAFREFGWMFTQVVTSSMQALGERPTYEAIQTHVDHIDALLVRYCEQLLDRAAASTWRAEIEGSSADAPRELRDRNRRAVRIVQYIERHRIRDTVADGLIQAFKLPLEYFRRISIALKPLLTKLQAGSLGALVSPDYDDPDDQRPILEFERAIQRNGVVYFGTDALSDPEIAAVLTEAAAEELASLAGRIYKRGLGADLPGSQQNHRPKIRIHLEEAAEVVRNGAVLRILNKGRGAGMACVLYAQSLSDLLAGTGGEAPAGQVLDNLGTLVMLRPASVATAELLTHSLDEAYVETRMVQTVETGSTDPGSGVDFTGSTGARHNETPVPLLAPAQLMKLPVGHAVVRTRAGNVYKIAIPELRADSHSVPPHIAALAQQMRQRYQPGMDWSRFEPSFDGTAFAHREAGS